MNKDCGKCHGKGGREIRKPKGTYIGLFGSSTEWKRCDVCRGSGVNPDYRSKSCSSCWSGIIEYSAKTPSEKVPDFCPSCRERKRNEKERERQNRQSQPRHEYQPRQEHRPNSDNKWQEKSCPGAPGYYCGNTIKYRTDWSNIPNYCESCRNKEFEKKCSTLGCDRTIKFKLSYTNVRETCGRCFKELERGSRPRLCTKCGKLMFVAPGKDYSVCIDCSQNEKAEAHEALRRSVQGRRISGSASSLGEYVRTLIQYIDSSDQVYLVDLSGAARQEWKLPPMKRGEHIDGGFDRGNLPYNFPTIDLWTNGDATSIKSLDIGATTYRNLNTLDRQVGYYIDELVRFTGSTHTPGIRSGEIKSRTLLLVVPLIGARDYQLNYLYSVGQSYYAQKKEVKIIVFIID